MRDVTKATFKAKWQDDDIVKRGFVCVPKCLFTCMGELGLKPQEAVLLINIIEKCWYEGDKAWPSVDYLAKNIGRKNSATRESLKSLAVKGFISKEQRFNSSNLYGLVPCIEKLIQHTRACRHIAGNPPATSWKSGGGDSRKSSGYINSNLNRTTNVETNNIRHRAKGDDAVSLNARYKKATCPETGGYHEWEEFEVDRGGNTYYYKRCEYCGVAFHKKDEPPFGEGSNYKPDDEFDRMARELVGDISPHYNHKKIQDDNVIDAAP